MSPLRVAQHSLRRYSRVNPSSPAYPCSLHAVLPLPLPLTGTNDIFGSSSRRSRSSSSSDAAGFGCLSLCTLSVINPQLTIGRRTGVVLHADRTSGPV